MHKQSFILPDGHPLANGYEVVACETCGFVFADTRVSQNDYDHFYAKYSKYQDAKTSTGGGGNPLDLKRLRDAAECVSAAIPNRQSRILDIGCATGGFLAALRDLGYANLVGVDPSEACVTATKELCNVEAYEGSLASMPAHLSDFDVVILSHVLEHVQDLKQCVDALRKLCSANGQIYVEVPNAEAYTDCLCAPFQDFNTEHINHFSQLSLQNLFVPRGWKVQSFGSKTLEAAPGIPYPATFAFFSKSEPGLLHFDKTLKPQIERYIEQSAAMMAAIDERLRQVLKNSPSVVLWGTGQLAMKLLVETCLRDAKIDGLIDSNPVNQGKVLRGLPILSPAKIINPKIPIIVSSLIQQHSIMQSIASLDIENPVILLGT